MSPLPSKRRTYLYTPEQRKKWLFSYRLKKRRSLPNTADHGQTLNNFLISRGFSKGLMGGPVPAISSLFCCVWSGLLQENLLSPSKDATFQGGKQSIVVFTPCPVHIFYPLAAAEKVLSLLLWPPNILFRNVSSAITFVISKLLSFKPGKKMVWLEWKEEERSF